MSRFRVTVDNHTGPVEEYTIYGYSHDNTNVRAAQSALKSYAEHGHANFPRSNRPLIIVVTEVEPGTHAP